MHAFMHAREGPNDINHRQRYWGASPQLQHMPEQQDTHGFMGADPQVTFTL
jgi:hypothetical protein